PESRVLVRDQFPLARERLQRLLLEHDLSAAVQIGPDPFRVYDEEPAVDEPLGDLGLFIELPYHRALDSHLPEARGRAHRGHGGDSSVAAMELDEPSEIDVGNAVAVGEQEEIVILDIGADAEHAPG